MNNENINRYMPLVVTEAERVKSKLSIKIELDDLVADGIFAVIDHLNSAGTSHGLDRNYIRIIRQGIFTELRNLAKWVSPKKWYELSRNEKLIYVLHRFEQVSFPEIADSLSISVEQVEKTFISTNTFLNG